MMEMIYPQRGTRVFIPRDFGGKPGRVVLEAVHRSVKARIYWYVDEQFLGVTHSHPSARSMAERRSPYLDVDG